MRLFNTQEDECLTAQYPLSALAEYLHSPWTMMPALPTGVTPCPSQHKFPIWELSLSSQSDRRTEPTSQAYPTGPAQEALHACLLRAPLILLTVGGSPQGNTAVALTSLPPQVCSHISPFGAAAAYNSFNNSWKATPQFPPYRQFLIMNHYSSAFPLMPGSIIRLKYNAVVLA